MKSPMVEELLNEAINEHLKDIVAQHGLYINRNEYYGVLLEELDELKEVCSDIINESYSNIESFSMSFMRKKISDANYVNSIEHIKVSLHCLMEEALDVTAVILKLEEQIRTDELE